MRLVIKKKTNIYCFQISNFILNDWKTGGNRECSDRQRAVTSMWLVDRRKSSSALCKWCVMQSNNNQLKGRCTLLWFVHCKKICFRSYHVDPKYKKKVVWFNYPAEYAVWLLIDHIKYNHWVDRHPLLSSVGRYCIVKDVTLCKYNLNSCMFILIKNLVHLRLCIDFQYL